MRKARKQYTPAEKVTILKRHLDTGDYTAPSGTDTRKDTDSTSEDVVEIGSIATSGSGSGGGSGWGQPGIVVNIHTSYASPSSGSGGGGGTSGDAPTPSKPSKASLCAGGGPGPVDTSRGSISLIITTVPAAPKGHAFVFGISGGLGPAVNGADRLKTRIVDFLNGPNGPGRDAGDEHVFGYQVDSKTVRRRILNAVAEDFGYKGRNGLADFERDAKTNPELQAKLNDYTVRVGLVGFSYGAATAMDLAPFLKAEIEALRMKAEISVDSIDGVATPGHPGADAALARVPGAGIRVTNSFGTKGFTLPNGRTIGGGSIAGANPEKIFNGLNCQETLNAVLVSREFQARIRKIRKTHSMMHHKPSCRR